MFALVDANSFYCSAEQVFRPDWRDKPIVVLSNNDGCIVAANRKAKEAGIDKFGPFFKQRELCKQHGIIALSSNYELYANLSAKMMGVIGRFAPEQYVYSIDESFLSFENVPCISDLHAYARDIRASVWRECRLPVCVGVGPTLTLAKLANHAAKKLSGYHGVSVLDTPTQRKTTLQAVKVKDVWGIGSKLSKRLQGMGITTAWQLAHMPPKIAAKRFSVEVERTIRELNGIQCNHWAKNNIGKKQIFSTRSVGRRITDLTSLQQALCKHAMIVAAKLRKQHSSCAQLMVFAHSSPFDENLQYFKYFHRFEVPTDDSLVINKAALHASLSLYRKGVNYYKIGVGAIKITATQHLQLDLLDDDPGNPQLMQVVDKLNHRYGPQTLFLASQGVHQPWRMRRDRLTPQYTTRWLDLPKIHC